MDLKFVSKSKVCYIDNIYIDNYTDKVFAFNIVKHEIMSNSFTKEIVSLDTLMEFYYNNLETKEYSVDFSFDGNIFYSDKVESSPLGVIKISKEAVESCYGDVKIYRNIDGTLYDLFDILVEYSGRFIHESTINESDDIIVRDSVLFLPKVSKTTMSLYIASNIEGEWKTTQLTYSDNGKIKYNEFYFAIDINHKGMVDKFNIKEVKIIKSEKSSIVVYKYCGELLLYTSIYPESTISRALLNKYMYSSVALTYYKMATDELIKMLLIEKNTADGVIKSYIGKSPDVDVKRVTIDMNHRKISKKEMSSIIKYITANIGLFKVEGKFNLDKFISILKNEGYDNMRLSVAYFIIVNLNYIHTIKTNLGRLNFLYDNKLQIDKEMYMVDRYIYQCRVLVYVMNMPLQYGDKEWITGSDSPYTCNLRRG